VIGRKRIAWLAAAGALCLTGVLASSQVPVPALAAHVTDLTGTLSAQVASNIDNRLAAFEAQKGSQIAVLIVPTTQPEEIEQFGIRVAEQWKLGRRNVDDGAILIVAKNDRRVRIEVGRGLEGALTDATSNRIIDEDITPRFKQGDFDGGIQAGVDRMIRVVSGEPLPPPPDQQWQRGRGLGHLLPLLLVGVFVVSGVLRSLLGPLGGSIATGGVVGVVTFLLSQVMLIGIGAGIIAFLFALLRGSIPGGGIGGLGGMRGFGGVGGFGGGGFGGGFSGGGGGFGGGGASGSW
jgi:uncharacterized protein